MAHVHDWYTSRTEQLSNGKTRYHLACRGCSATDYYDL